MISSAGKDKKYFCVLVLKVLSSVKIKTNIRKITGKNGHKNDPLFHICAHSSFCEESLRKLQIDV
jgi:hypothetical protein